MDNNPYGEQLSWVPPSEQHSYDAGSGQVYYHYPLNSQQGKIASTPNASERSRAIQQEEHLAPLRMPKEQALAMVSSLKRLSLIASIALFGVFSGIIATHLKVSANQGFSLPLPPHASSPVYPAPSDDHADPNADSGGFFNHHHHREDGFGFGNAGSPQQQPNMGTHVSGR